jgi:hypothetical protein
VKFPLSLWDISLWLAVTAIVLLITSEILSSQRYGRINIRIDKKKLHNVAIVVSIVFLATVAIRIINMLSSP